MPPNFSRYRTRPKYGNVKTASGFDSKREEKRYGELVLLQQIGEISDLKRQVKFELLPRQDGERAVSYFADFTYLQDGKLVAEDVKSKATITTVYILKRKLLLFRHGIRIKEIL